MEDTLTYYKYYPEILKINNSYKLIKIPYVYLKTALSELTEKDFSKMKVFLEEVTTIDLTLSVNKPHTTYSYPWLQGACSDLSGEYYYISILGYRSKTGIGRYTKLLKIDATNNIVKRNTDGSSTLELGHANTLLYNPSNEDHPIYVCYNKNRSGTGVTTIMPVSTDLKTGTSFNLSFVPANLGYNHDQQKYASIQSGTKTLHILDSNLTTKKSVDESAHNLFNTSQNQGIHCTKDYIICSTNKVLDDDYLQNINYLTFFDWDGNFENTFELPAIVNNDGTSPEIEDIFEMNDELYATFSNWETGYVYRVVFYYPEE